jgi:hypothetical protein
MRVPGSLFCAAIHLALNRITPAIAADPLAGSG